MEKQQNPRDMIAIGAAFGLWLYYNNRNKIRGVVTETGHTSPTGRVITAIPHVIVQRPDHRPHDQIITSSRFQQDIPVNSSLGTGTTWTPMDEPDVPPSWQTPPRTVIPAEVWEEFYMNQDEDGVDVNSRPNIQPAMRPVTDRRWGCECVSDQCGGINGTSFVPYGKKGDMHTYLTHKQSRTYGVRFKGDNATGWKCDRSVPQNRNLVDQLDDIGGGLGLEY